MGGERGARPVVAMHPVSCDPQILGGLMPLCLWLDRDGVILGAGPTLLKLAGSDAVGQKLDAVFALIHPRRIDTAADLTCVSPLRLSLRGPVATSFKGGAVLLPGGQVLMNLSFGSGLRAAVRDHALSDTDFAPTDLAFEMLYLTEANAAVIAEARKFSERLGAARAQAQEQALTDPLTGLRNRRGLDRTLAVLGRSGLGFGMIHVDLDHFKQVNDQLGHAEGDRVLQSVAARLSASVRDGDTVARVGGDEFVILMPSLRERDALERVARRILDHLAEPIGRAGGHPTESPITVTASLGVVVWAGKGRADTEALLQRADRALYRSKDTGRGRFSFSEAD